MTEENIEILYKNVKTFIERRRLKEALDLLKRWSRHESVWPIMNRVTELEGDYQRMLEFTVQGYVDENREDFFSRICSEALSMSDRLRFKGLCLISQNPVFEEAREGDHLNLDEGLSELILIENRLESKSETAETHNSLLASYYNILGRLFRTIWSISILSKSDKDILKEYLTSSYTLESGKCILISALTTSLLQSFDVSKFILLKESYLSGGVKSKARAIIGILGALIVHSYRCQRENEVIDMINYLLLDEQFNKEFETALLAVVKTRETKRIQKQMTDDIIPEIIRMRSKISERLGDISEINPEMIEGNPEWEEILSDSSLKDKLKYLNDLQLEGSDVMLSAFSRLKDFSFFNVACNWLVPFSKDHPEINNIFNDISSLGDVLSTLDIMCDSDKYSFTLSLKRMPENQRRIVFGQLESQLIHLKEEKSGGLPELDAQIFEKEVTGYVRDLYRFYTLFPGAKKMVSGLFDREIKIDDFPKFSISLIGKETLELIAEFYFIKKFYAEAIPVFESILEYDESDGRIYQKLGFAYSSINNYRKALENYRMSELLTGEGAWLATQMGHCYMSLGKYPEAAECYKIVESKKPEDINAIINLGHALMYSEDFEGACRAYYKAYFLKNDSLSLMRALAWCELRQGNYEKSRNFYEKILLESPSAIDYLNFGHLEVLESNYKNGAELYKQAAFENENGAKWIVESLNKDSQILYSGGLSETMLKAILDYVLYSLNKY